MKSTSVLCLLFFACTINISTLSAQKIFSPTDTGIGETFAVIVGITNYENPAIPALQFADKDAQQFSAFIQSKGGGSVPESHIKLLVNKEATIAAVYDALDWLKFKCKKDDVAYIYFSGHGDVETKNNFSKGFLLAYNSPQTNYANNAIRVEDINTTSIILSTKNKAKVILISDACHSGKMAGDFYKGKQLVSSQLNLILNNQVRLASCAENEEAAEGPEWGGGRGVFSYYLVMGLQGLADIRKAKTIELRDLTKYLDSSFSADQFLLKNKHTQHPVTDGNPNYPLAVTDSPTLHSLMATLKKNQSGIADLPPGLMTLRPLQPQPIDYFFTAISVLPLESMVNFDSYARLDAAMFPVQLINDCIAYQKSLSQESGNGSSDKNYNVLSLDSLNLLRNQVSENKSINNRFVEKFIQSVHGIGQEMINAYLKGDLEDLERRQYYYSGKRDYKKYLSMLHIALKFVPENHQLSHIIKVHNFYITGLINRMQMATNPNADSLIKLAFYNQQQALKLEPYAAYILNETGNLYLYKKNYDSAKYNFHLASVISEKWAIPWSNKMRMNMVLNRFGDAEQDFKTADSLQPGLAHVFTNFGMLMEKKNNLLAAESYYLRAIKENSVHYLPFQQLGYIYLKTAEYNKANYYLHEAETRKHDFAIVPETFADGIVEGVADFLDVDVPDLTGCPQKLNDKNERARVYIQLLNDLQKSDSGNERKIALQELVNKKPGLPLASHYLGKKYYQSGEWQLARKALEQSVSNYLSEDELKKKLTLDINGTSFSSDFACELRPFLKYQYDELEDHYLLASLYEKSAENVKAFAQYKITSAIENTRQLHQTTFAGILKNQSSTSPEERENLLRQSEKFIFMAGSIKASRLHAKLGEYLEAEKILLHQVSLSRAAGNAYVKEGNSGYWLLINSYLESETYNFYKKILDLFPRDPLWQQKAGLFLYNRLASSFSQLPVDKQREFYEQMQWYTYPWQDDHLMGSKYNSMIPGTGENLAIIATKFDPVKESLNALRLSVKLSGDILPDIEAAKALADLNSWMGNEEQAIFWFKQSLSIKPSDAVERNKFLYYLNQIGMMPDASKQLDILYQQKKITRNQTIQLAIWKWLSGENKKAATIINAFNPVGENEKRSVLLFSARMRMLSGDTKNALQILLDTSTIWKRNINDSYESILAEQTLNSGRLYSIARLYAILKNDSLALNYLKDALDSGFKNSFVLQYDNVWASFWDSEKWKYLVNKYDFSTDHLKHYININNYSVPHGLK